MTNPIIQWPPITTAAVVGGSIDNTPIGATTPSTAAFTTETLGGVSQSPYAAAPLFGTGADGNVTISSGTVVLTQDLHAKNLTINGTGQLNVNGFRVFVSNTLDLSAAQAGAIFGSGTTPGNNASGATGGAQPFSPAAIELPGYLDASGGTGGSGNTTTGTPGSAGIQARYGNGGGGGAGGAGGSGVSAGAASIAGVYHYSGGLVFSTPSHFLAFFDRFINPLNGNLCAITGGVAGSGGSQGGGDGTNAGGGGGGGGVRGGVLALYARFIARGSNSTAGIIQVRGGPGGNGANGVAGNAGAGGGAGGGGGGWAYIVVESLTGTAITGAIDVSGGTGGNGGNGSGTGKGGNGGSGGNAGNVHIINLSTPSFFVSSFNAAGTAGSTTSTSTGATGGAGATLQVNL